MDRRAARDLIAAAVLRGAATWADLGAGAGTFTLALAELLGPDARVIAVDRDAHVLRELRAAAAHQALEAEVLVQQQDFHEPLSLPPLDGILLANALHFVPTTTQADFVARLVTLLRPAGRLLVVDYERRAANPWVPYPVSPRRLRDITKQLALPPPRIVGSRPSRYGGELYAALTVLSGKT